MSKVKTAISLFSTPGKMIVPLAELGLFNWMPDELYLKMVYYGEIGKTLNLKNPVTFNEKLQWLKLYDRKPIYQTMVDKYEVKQYVADIIGEKYVIPTLGIWDHVEDIPFKDLPDQFVLKCTHDSGSVVICKDKNDFDNERAKEKLRKKQRHSTYWFGREWPYKNMKPRIIAEKYLEDRSTAEQRDYKFFCFNGIAKCFKIDFDRFKEHHAHYFSVDGSLLKVAEAAYPPDYSRARRIPKHILQIKELAEQLSKVSPFLRADFYDVDGSIYFGELTFYPASGLNKFIYEGNDEMLGSWLTIPSEIYGGGYILLLKDVICTLIPRKGPAQETSGLTDYKIHCFHGAPKIILVCQDRYSKNGMTEDFFDAEWNHLEVSRGEHPNASIRMSKPKELSWLLDISAKLSADIPFLRTDFYLVNGQLYFGELTFFPASGLRRFVPESFDETMGNWLQIP